MMRVFVEGLHVEVEIGALEREHGRRQAIIIDIAADVEMPEHDDVSDACDYRVLARAACDSLAHGHIVLVETAAKLIVDACLACTKVDRVTVTVRKPAALAPAIAGVTLTRSRPSS